MLVGDVAGGASFAIFSLTPVTGNLAIEGLLTRVLHQEGHAVTVIMCNGARARCTLDLFHEQAGSRTAMCITCIANTEEALAAWGGERPAFVHLSDLIDTARMAAATAAIAALSDDDVLTFAYDGMPMGEWVIAALKVDYFGELWRRLPDWPAKGRLWLHGTVAAALAAEAYFRQARPDGVILLSGVTPAEKAVWTVAERQGIRCVLYEGGQQPGAVTLRDSSPACEYDFSPEWQAWAGMPLSVAESSTLDRAIHDRRRLGPVFSFVLSPPATDDLPSVRQALGLEAHRQVIVVFSGCVADSCAFASNVAFDSQSAWLEACVAFAVAHPQIDLVVRVHPAEETMVSTRNHRRVESNERAADVISARWPQLPANVRLIPATSKVSSYDLVKLATLVLPYISTLGIEASAMGVPVVVAGRCHYSGLGIVWPVPAADAFTPLLERLLARPDLPPGGQELARRYMYFWFNRCNPLLPGLPLALKEQVNAPTGPLPYWEVPGDASGLARIADYLTGRGPVVMPPPAWRYRDVDQPLPVRAAAMPLVVVVPDGWDPALLANAGLKPLLAADTPVIVKVVTQGMGLHAAAQCLSMAQDRLGSAGTALQIDVLPPEAPDEIVAQWLMLAAGIIAPAAGRMPAIMAMAAALNVPVIASPTAAVLPQALVG